MISHEFHTVAKKQFAENRICFFAHEEVYQPLSEMSEAEAVPDILKSEPALHDALRMVLAAAPAELRNDPIQRDYYTALALPGMIGNWDRITMPTAHSVRAHITPSHVLPILKDTLIEDKNLGEFVYKTDPAFAARMLGKVVDVTDYEELGNKYRAQSKTLDDEWETHKPLDTTSLQLLPAAYIRNRNVVDALLEAKGIQVDHQAVGSGTPDMLTGTEYLRLLSLAWQEDTGEEVLEKIGKAADDGADALRNLEYPPEAGHALKAHTDIKLDQDDSAMVLGRFNIALDADLQSAYVQQRMQAPAAFPDANTWLTNPGQALEFLESKNFSSKSDGNMEFIIAIRWHLLQSESEKKSRIDAGETAPKMTKEDVVALLRRIVQAFEIREMVVSNAMNDRMAAIREKGWFETIEGGAKKIPEYIREFNKHPIGSIFMVMAAFLALKGAYKLLLGKNANGESRAKLWHLLAFGSIAGYAAVTHYQDGTKGSSFWGMKDWLGGFWSDAESENAEPDLATYWGKELQTDPARESVAPTPKQRTSIVSMLHDQPMYSVLEWYGKMEGWRVAGSSGRPPRMPFRLPGYERLIGARAPEDVGSLTYETLREFFALQGKKMDEDAPDAAATGYQYILAKFAPHMLPGDAGEGAEIADALAALPQRTMAEIFLVEADISQLKKMGGRAAKAGSLMENISAELGAV